MKKSGASAALLTPDAHGWRVRLPTGQYHSGKTLDEVVNALPATQPIHLALPCQIALLERVRLPSTDREELTGMLQLQLEKTLPYPVEDVSSDFEVIQQEGSESTLLSVVVNNAQLDRLCEPLRAKTRLPEKVTVYAMHIAHSCPPDQTTLCLWPEDEQLVAAICEGGKLGFAQTLSGMDAATVLAELPPFLLSAEMEGVPTDFSSLRLEQGCGGLRDHIRDYFGKPVEIISFDAPLPVPATNLVPPSWLAERRRVQQSGQLKSRLQIAAAVYLLLVAGAFLYLAYLKRQVQKVDLQLAQTQPQIEFAQSRQAKWLALAPAIDPSRYAVEILDRLYANRPASDVKFTVVDVGPYGWKVEGEAPSVGSALDFTEKLRNESGLKAFRIDAPQPKILPNESAQFVIYGKI